MQVSFSIIDELSKIDPKNKYVVFCLDALHSQLEQINLPGNFELVKITDTPAKLRSRRSIVSSIESHIKNKKIQILLTVFGPSYWKPSIPHVCGFADPWCFNPDSVAYKLLPIVQRIKRRLLSRYKLYHLKKEAQLFFIETEYARKKLAKVSGISEDLITVVGNNYNATFLSQENHMPILPPKEDGDLRFLLLSANYPHKNIEILNQVIPLLKEKIENFHFITTLPQIDFDRIFTDNVKPFLINVGPIPVKACVQLYKEVDYTFLPTLLEAFTATYPESMFMKKPILTSDLPFARDICQNAAIYFKPLLPADIVTKIVSLVKDENMYQNLITNGLTRVEEFPSARDRAQILLDLLLKIKSQTND